MRKEIYRISAAMAVVFLAVSALWAGGTNSRFKVISTIPASSFFGVKGVALEQVLTATFNQDVDCSTVNNLTFTLKSGSGHHVVVVAGSVTCFGMVATFAPSSPLAPNTDYTATITNKVKNVKGQRLECDFVWCFRTGSSSCLTAPTVTAVTPLNHATGVALNTKVTAAFDQAMNPHSINASTFTLTAGPHHTSVRGTITYDAINNIAIFTPNANLLPNTTYTATITTCVTNKCGAEMVSSFVWTFKTGAAPDVVPPTVISTIPAKPPVACVPTNQIITATFSEAMNSLSVTTPPQFTLQETIGPVSVPGVVTYAAVGNTATFTPNNPLTPLTQYTATILTGVKDLAGNHLLSPYVWTFTTCAGPLIISPTVILTNPLNSATGVCINGAINATFSEPMNFGTFNSGTFKVTGPALALVLGTLSIDVTGTIVTFTPTSNLAPNTPYQATITTGVTDLLGDPLLSDYVWSFSTGTNPCIEPVPLGTAGVFGMLGGGGLAGMTNQGIDTVINGNIGTTAASTLITGFHDLTVPPYIQFTHGCIYTETTLNVGKVTGEIYTAAGTSIPSVALGCTNEGTATTAGIAAAAAADALIAYNALAALPVNHYLDGGDLGGLVLPPGVYTSSSTYGITGSPLTLDAQGNANAVWVFQVGSALTVGGVACESVLLTNGAQPKNVFWQVGSSAVINYAGGCTMVGTIIAQAGVTLSSPANSTSPTLTVLDGRAIGLTASVTVVQTVINVPAP